MFIHAEACAGYASTGSYPPGYRDWPTMVFRPYCLLADPAIEFIHARNVRAGCFMFRIGRPGA